MRLTPCVLLPAVACAANLYIYDPQTSRAVQDTTTISADTARLVIASRLGLDRYHSLATQDQSVLDHINQLSGVQPIFSSQEAHVALILAQGISQDDLPKALGSAHVQTVDVSGVPSLSDNEKLVLDLAIQAGGLHADQSNLRDSLFTSVDGHVFSIEHDSGLLKDTFDTLIREHYTILTLAVSNDTASKHTYGLYDMPAALHHKRQFKEAPLITESKTSASTLKATLTPNAPANNSALRGILPQCFPSLATCQSMTRNCTGHGACSLAHTDKDAADLSGKCYSCSCKADVRTNKDGTKKTTRWGGPACQKQDVVVPFWLIASFTVFFTFVITWGIGLLYSMGSQELPSVIGAGVSGVPRSK